MSDPRTHQLPPPLDAETQVLLRGVPPLSSASIEAMKARVLFRLERGETGSPVAPKWRPRPLAWTALATFLLGSAAAALYLRPELDRTAPPFPAPSAPREAQPSVPPSAEAEARAESGETPEESTQAPARTGGANRRVGPSKPPSETAKVSPLYEAAHLLRKQKKPAEALAQLNRLDAATQNSEEALALRMESLFMMGSPEAKNVAQSYLARFPLGRYRKHALRIRGGNP